MQILVINPGSTSTKIAVFDDEKKIFATNISHSPEELAPFKRIPDQQEFRHELVVKTLREAGFDLKFDAVIGRGSLAKPVAGGVFAINEKMIKDSKESFDQHACNLACGIAYEIAKLSGCPSYTADPVTVDELNDWARITGLPELPHQAIWHALNQRAIARRYCKEHGTRYEDVNLIVCHMGGGISVTAHEHGYAVDTNNALTGNGPFSPERAGTLPAGKLVKLCFSGKYTEAQMMKKLAGAGGLAAHLGTTDAREVEQRIAAGDEKAKLIFDTMIYHIAKAIASYGATLKGKVDAIVLTGGIAHSKYVVAQLTERVGWMAPIACYPGEDEMEALALNALGVLHGELTAKEY